MEPLHATACQYGYLFSYVPGDSGNPFVALWQASLVNALVLGGETMTPLYASNLTRRVGPRVLGYSYLAVSVMIGILALIVVALSTPLTCGGAPSSPPPTES